MYLLVLVLSIGLPPPGSKPHRLPPAAATQPAEQPRNVAVAEPEQPAEPHASVPPPRTMEAVILDLSHPDWRTRHAACEELFQLEDKSYPALKAEFRRTSSFEVKRRIRYVVEQIYFYKATESRGGFLGIQHKYVDHSEYSEVPEGMIWIAIDQVVHNTAASRAGLKAGDFITTIDDKGLKANAADDFATQISGRRPGTRVKLGIRRFGTPLTVEAVLGRRTLDTFGFRGMMPLQSALEQRMQSARNRFNTWWRTEFDPNGEVDESPAAAYHPQWTLEPANISPAPAVESPAVTPDNE